MLKKMECGSVYTGKIAKGCRYCIDGSKMVLFITGRCEWNCYYCPVSLEKKGRDVVYANERQVHSDAEIIAEAEAMDAVGTGITGGDPLLDMERTVHMIRLLKNKFGSDHHIHLYTATINPEKALTLQEAGLDEIRFHPSKSMWTRMSETRFAETVKVLSIDVGVEVPALPNRERELNSLVSYAREAGVRFVNLNELELSESNWDMMEVHRYEVRDELSFAVAGSRETAMTVLKSNKRAHIHFCSSTFKDGVQLRRRLIRRAKHTTMPYQQVTEDGTIVHGYLYADDLERAKRELLDIGVPADLMEVLGDRIEVAPWILKDIASLVGYRCFLSEQYPTAEGLEVEKVPLNRCAKHRKMTSSMRDGRSISVDADALNLMMPVHDVPGNA